ncbi:MAG: LysM peptidoglycan-binding domain-containing protein [Anaerolineae bacterium]|nr:LysM peptidoglycan-binding domain-containing protein [Anaerolineae bacterium]
MAAKYLSTSVLGGTARLLSLAMALALLAGLLLAAAPLAAAPAAAQTCQATHVVRAGETLASIGRQYGVSWTAIAQANNLSNANRIYSGQALCIPPAGATPPPAPTCIATHVVQPGETLAAIGRRYNVSWTAIASANNLANANHIYSGQSLCIPGGSTTPPANAVGTVSGVYYLNVRSGPGMTYERIIVIGNGTQVTLLGRDTYGGWLKVRLASGVEGWVGSAYISSSTVFSTLPVVSGSVQIPPPAGGATGIVATYGLNLRTGPGTNYPVILALSQGMTVPVSHRNSDATWVRLTLPGGTVGWVSAPYLTLSTAIVNLPIWN